MSDGKYFSNVNKKGEMFDLKAGLRSDRIDKRLSSMKRIIAGMTLGKDMCSLFSDVLSCGQTDNIELKKLAYLFLITNADRQPEESIMAVNTLIRDCLDHRPMIRALAVRTLGSIKVPVMAEHLADSLRQCLKDEDPYVRKTAVVCVAKLYFIDSDLVENLGFVELLINLLSDANPFVLSNTIVALLEIDCLPTLTTPLVQKLLVALGECNEWGQIFILEALSHYESEKEWEVKALAERVSVYLVHANSAIVLTSLRILFQLIHRLPKDHAFTSVLVDKISPSLATLMSAEPEIQFVALRNIAIIIQKLPVVLRRDVRLFFIKYNDPIYIKMEKLEILVQLATQENIHIILSELKEYAREIDVDFVRKSIRAIGRCAIKIDSSAEQCIQVLLKLVETKVAYILEEAIIVFRDIFRRYPNRFESVATVILEDIENLDCEEVRGAVIWMLGEYAESIDDADTSLECFIDNFRDESPVVQLALLTAIVKLLLKKPLEATHLAQKTLQLAVDSGNPDLRDRGYIYWRLLSTDPQAAQMVVLSEKPPISAKGDCLEVAIVDKLMRQIGSVASVLHKSPESFLSHK